MKTKLALCLIVCAFVFGCANSATRFSLDAGEGSYTYSNATTKDQKTAFYLAEQWLSSTIQNANKVITLRQPETGTLVAQPAIQVPVGLTSFWGTYTLRINCDDNNLTTMFTVGTLENGTYPPKNAMPKLELDFRTLSIELLDFIESN